MSTTTPPIIDDREIRALGRLAQPAASITGQKKANLVQKIKQLLIEKPAGFSG